MHPIVHALRRNVLIVAPQLLPITQEDLEFAVMAWRMFAQKMEGATGGQTSRRIHQAALVAALTCVASMPVRAQLRATTSVVAPDEAGRADRVRIPTQLNVEVQ